MDNVAGILRSLVRLRLEGVFLPNNCQESHNILIKYSPGKIFTKQINKSLFGLQRPMLQGSLLTMYDYD